MTFPSIGRIVRYELTTVDAEQINRRRTNSQAIKDAPEGYWPEGAQAHIGIDVTKGDELAMIITRVCEEHTNCVNGKVLLDGTDTFWAQHRMEGHEPGGWTWPEIGSKPKKEETQ